MEKELKDICESEDSISYFLWDFTQYFTTILTGSNWVANVCDSLIELSQSI